MALAGPEYNIYMHGKLSLLIFILIENLMGIQMLESPNSIKVLD